MLFARPLGLTRDPYASTSTTSYAKTAVIAPTAPKAVEQQYTSYVAPAPAPAPTVDPWAGKALPAEQYYALAPEPTYYAPAPAPEQPTYQMTVQAPLPENEAAQQYAVYQPTPEQAQMSADVAPPPSPDLPDGGWAPADDYPMPNSTYSQAPPQSAGTQVNTTAPTQQPLPPGTVVSWYSPKAWAAAFKALPPIHKGVLFTGLGIAMLGAFAIGGSRRRSRST